MSKRKLERINKPRSDQELAEEIELHRDDTRGWDSGPNRATVRKGSSVVFSLRLSVEELEVLRDRAEAHQMTVSEVIREAVFANAVCVSISPTPVAFVGSGSVSAVGFASATVYGGCASISGVCNDGPFPAVSACDWDNFETTACFVANASSMAHYAGLQGQCTTTANSYAEWGASGIGYFQGTFNFPKEKGDKRFVQY